MTRPLLVFCLLALSAVSYAQSQFYVGLKGGIDGCFYQFSSPPTSSYTVPGTTTTVRMTSKGSSIPAVFELIYSIKKFRVGYQFEYERILTNAYTIKGTVSYDSTYNNTVRRTDIKQHFFCHNLLIEYQLYSYKKLKIVPDLTFGYYHGLSQATDAPYGFDYLNQNRFKLGVAMNFEYQMGQVSVVATPHYGIVPIKSIYDPNSKGFIHFLGLHIGIRIGCIKIADPNAPADAKKKKKKEYVNPEDDDN